MKSAQIPYYSPAEILNIGSGNTKTFEFRGTQGNIYGFNRIIAGCEDPSLLNKLSATAILGKRTKIFEDVQLLALNRLFEDRSLKGAYDINPNKKLTIDVTNLHGAALNVGMNLNGYDEAQLQRKKRQYLDRSDQWPVPEFVYGNAEIAASADSSRIKLDLPTHDCRIERIAISSESDDDMQVSLLYDNIDIMPERFLSQINDEFRTMPIVTPFTLQNHLNFYAVVSNLDAVNAHKVSVICECYRV